MNTRNRTSSEYIGYGLSIFLFFRSFIKKDIRKIIVLFYKEREIMYQSIWNWIQQKYKPKKIFERKKKIKEFIIDETLIIVGSELIDMALGCYYYRT
jgi:hypothetical protein